MPIVFAAVVVLVLVALFAAPALAAKLAAPTVAQPVVVVAVDTLDKHINFDSQLGGAIKLDLSSSKLADKWRVTSLKCDDVTVVATDAQVVVATTKAVPGSDQTSCVYSMKVPSGEALSVYAEVGSPSSVGITGSPKLADGSYAKAPITSDLKTQGYLKLDYIKSDALKVKLTAAGSETLPLYIKLDS